MSIDDLEEQDLQEEIRQRLTDKQDGEEDDFFCFPTREQHQQQQEQQ